MDGTDNFEDRGTSLNDACVKQGEAVGLLRRRSHLRDDAAHPAPARPRLPASFAEPPPAGISATCDTAGFSARPSAWSRPWRRPRASGTWSATRKRWRRRPDPRGTLDLLVRLRAGPEGRLPLLRPPRVPVPGGRRRHHAASLCGRKRRPDHPDPPGEARPPGSWRSASAGGGEIVNPFLLKLHAGGSA